MAADAERAGGVRFVLLSQLATSDHLDPFEESRHQKSKTLESGTAKCINLP